MRRMRVVAINEDNNDEEAWKRLEDPSTHILYASPEILLSTGKFKALFRLPQFRSRVLGFILDEAHVTQSWKDDFRKAYGDLGVLKTVAGSDLPWAAVSATMPTQVLNTVGDLLKFGTRPFWGADLGADRDNNVRPRALQDLGARDQETVLLVAVLVLARRERNLPNCVRLARSARLVALDVSTLDKDTVAWDNLAGL